MSISYNIFSEVEISEYLESNPGFEDWLKANAHFEHRDACEYILHLYPTENDNWFGNYLNTLKGKLPEQIKNMIYEARRSGASRICFYA